MNENTQTTSLPVSYVAGVKLKPVIIPKQSLLDMIEVHWLAVDGYEAHAALEGQSRVLTARRRTACVEMTHIKYKDLYLNMLQDNRNL